MRPDGYRLKDIDPMYTVAAHIMDKRNDAMNMITIDIPFEPMQEYLNNKHKEGKDISHLALIISAYVRVVSEFPELNRFFVNKTPYARKDFSVAMVVLKNGDYGHGTIAKFSVELDSTIFEVNDAINKFVEENRQNPENNGTEKLLKVFLGIPGLLRFGVAFCKMLDKFGLLPKKLVEMSPFHNSLLVSNLASIRTNHLYHHIYNFGTTSILITMGNTREVPKRKGKEIQFEKSMPLGVVMDERIASGTYFALAFRRIRAILKNPEILETKPEKITPDPAVKIKKKG